MAKGLLLMRADTTIAIQVILFIVITIYAVMLCSKVAVLEEKVAWTESQLLIIEEKKDSYLFQKIIRGCKNAKE